MPKDDFASARQFFEQKSRDSGTVDFNVDEFQAYWRKKGPIVFAEDYLICPLDVPIHPDSLKENPIIHHEHDWCPLGREHPKFREDGTPYHVILSEEQKIFLTDIWLNDVRQALIVAGRGCGKTFIFGVYNCWIISCFEKKSITCMGGSSKQSEIIQGYIEDWRIDLHHLKYIIYKNLQGIEKKAKTIKRSRCDFSACSPTAARGPHVNIVEIDEAAEAEDKSEDGAKAVAAVQWQTTGKRNTLVLLASTAQYAHGTFYEYMTNPDFGYKVYCWGIAKHISGEKNPLKVYTDKDPKHWLPAVWWLTQTEVESKRKSKSDEEWLAEALGGVGMTSGAVFKQKDLDNCICTICKDVGCEPYKVGYCKLLEMGAALGTPEDPIKYIQDRISGFDYGVSEAPCALSIIGFKGDLGFVLFNDEQNGLTEQEKADWVTENCNKFGCFTIVPDPAIGGKHLNEAWSDRGFAVYTIPEADKMPRVYNVMNHVEKHMLIIPMAFWYLTQSLKKLCWDKDNKIRKINDHSFDTLAYCLVDHEISEYDPFQVTTRMPTSDDAFKNR